MGSDLKAFLTRGFCDEFYRGLERLTGKLYYKYRVQADYDLFYENVREKVEDILSQGIFDETKGNLYTFIHTMIRNEASKLNHKESKTDHTDVYEYLEKPQGYHVKDKISPSFLYLARVSDLGIQIDEESFHADIHTKTITPQVFAYLWLMGRGGLRVV